MGIDDNDNDNDDSNEDNAYSVACAIGVSLIPGVLMYIIKKNNHDRYYQLTLRE